MWHVTVRARRAHAGAIGEVAGRRQFGIDVLAHLMARDTELLGVGDFERGVEAAPEHHARNESADGEESQAEMNARPAEDEPGLADDSPAPHDQALHGVV